MSIFRIIISVFALALSALLLLNIFYFYNLDIEFELRLGGLISLGIILLPLILNQILFFCPTKWKSRKKIKAILFLELLVLGILLAYIIQQNISLLGNSVTLIYVTILLQIFELNKAEIVSS